MESDILFQTHIFFIFILNGIAIGIIFDIFRTLRKVFKTTDIITYIEDILFWIFSGGLTLYLIFYFNNGKLRSYIFIGLIVGIVLYMLLLSKKFIKLSIMLILIIKKITKILLWPIRVLFTFMIRIKEIVIKFFKNIFQKSSNYLKNTDKFIKKHFKFIKKKEKRDKYRII